MNAAADAYTPADAMAVASKTSTEISTSGVSLHPTTKASKNGKHIERDTHTHTLNGSVTG